MDENLANEEREAFESRTPGLYTGSGKGEKQAKGKFKGIFKRKGPVALIIGLVFGAGGLIGGSQLMQPFSLIEQFRETFNTMQTSARVRSGSFFRYQLGGNVKNPIKGKIFGANEFKITKNQAQKLKAQGIDVDDDYEGTGTRVLKFDDGSGNTKIVTADAATAAKLGNGAVDFDTLYKTNADFYNGYNKGSMTWRGAIANWFDTATVNFLQKNGITRNLFQDFQRRVEEENAGNTRSGALDIMAREAEDITDKGYAVLGEKEEYEKETTETDPSTGEEVTKKTYDWKSGDMDGRSFGEMADELNKVALDHYGEAKIDDESVVKIGEERSHVEGASTIKRSAFTKAGSQKAAESAVKTKLDDITGKVQKGANIACTLFNVVGSINMLVSASETLQVISLVKSYFEAIDKVKAGDGTDSPIHDLTNALNEKKENTHETISSVSSTTSGEVSIDTSHHEDTKSAMESNGIVALYGGGKINPKDPSVQSFNFSSNVSNILGGLGTGIKLFATCGAVKMAANAVSATADFLTLGVCILSFAGVPITFGASLLAGCSAFGLQEIGKKALFSVGIGVVVAAFVSAIVPTVAKALSRDLITDIGGEDLGNALMSGANIYMGSTHRANGGSLASREKYEAFAAAQQAVIADNAKFERQNRDPFDATSKYTFLGTLMGQLMKFSSVSSVMSAVTSMSSSVSSSMIALNSSAASAYDIAADLLSPEEFAENCPYLNSIGAVGDAFCNPLTITDVSTIDDNPADVIDEIADSLEDGLDGNVTIKSDSDLAKYVSYCNGRTSSFGVVDWNIANELGSWGQVSTNNSTFNTVANSAIGAIPVLGDFIDTVQSEDTLKNAAYVDGEACVAGNHLAKGDLTNKDVSGWEEKAKYYQRFIEDQSLAETMGLIEKSAVTAYLEEYYKEHPLDNSYEGILARYSGLPKDDVIALLDFIDYANYIANYDPSERYVFDGATITPEDKKILFVDENEEKFYNVWWYNNIYDRVGKAEARAKKAEYWVC